MNTSECAVSDWLTRQGCHWLYVEQSPGSLADGAKRAKPGQQIHRPDFLAMMDGFGTIAIDVKGYAFECTYVSLETTAGDEPVSFGLPIEWVLLAWEDVCGLYEFHRVFNIPTWICLVDTSNENGCSAWIRADRIYESYSRLFLQEHFYRFDNQLAIATRYFSNWPEIRLEHHKVKDPKRLTFQLLIADPQYVDALGLEGNAQELYVSPNRIRLAEKTSLRELVNIWPAKKRSPNAASNKQMSLARLVGEALNIALPDELDKNSVSNFISRNIENARLANPNIYA